MGRTFDYLDLKQGVNSISVIDPSNGFVVYEIENKLLAKTQDGNLSMWILHLLKKSWITEDILYKIAAITNKLHPSNGIDWQLTFEIVERNFSTHSSSIPASMVTSNTKAKLLQYKIL